MLNETNKQFLTSILTGQAETIDHQLEQANNAARIGAQILETTLTAGHTPDEKVFRLLLNNSGPFTTTIYYIPREGPVTVYLRNNARSTKAGFLINGTIDNHPNLSDKLMYRHDVSWTKVHANPYTEAYDRIISATTPIHVHGEIVGEFGISVSVILLTAQFNHRQAIRGSYNFLLDANKQLVACPPLALVDLKPAGQTTINRGMLDLSKNKNQSFQKVLHTMALGNEAVEQVSFLSGEKIIAYRPLLNATWRLGLVVPEELASITTQELTSFIENRNKGALVEMIFISFMLLGLTLIIVAIYAKKMTRPLKEITAAANQISQGKLDQRLPVTSRDEIGLLATSFNEMTRQLKEFIGNLNESENRYRVLFESSPISLWEEDCSEIKKAIEVLRKEGISEFATYFSDHPEKVYEILELTQIKDVNDATVQLFGATSKDELIKNLPKLLKNTSFDSLKEELLAIAENRMFEIESQTKTLDGRNLALIQRSSTPPGFEDNWEKVLISLFDLTERKQFIEEKSQLENQLLQAYKMEAIGTLAGGIAHDFNNILAAILGYTELLKTEIPTGSKADEFVNKVMLAGNRARELVSQMLTFSRRSTPSMNAVSLKMIIDESAQLLRASIPTTIDIRQNIETDGIVMADDGQMHQVMINICTNASLAIQPESGTMVIHLKEISGLEIPEAISDGKADTTFVYLSVSDTGCGMPEDIIDRIFEPFFTTRKRYKGTGMGLAVVHGIIKSSGGYLHVDSTPGEGSNIGFSLPKANIEPAVSETPVKFLTEGVGENILYVDDESALTDLVSQMLSAMKYNVTTFNSPTAALSHFKARPAFYKLVITDLTMPEMTGDKLASAILEIRPDIPILLCTGYNDLGNTNNQRFHSNKDFLKESGITSIFNKPFTADEMKQQVRNALNPVGK